MTTFVMKQAEITLIIGAAHSEHNFIIVNITSRYYFMAKRFDHITVILRPTTGTKMYTY
jgi:hypothetical protein